MNTGLSDWQLLVGWVILIAMVGVAWALLEWRDRRRELPRQRPGDDGPVADADRRRLQADLALHAELPAPIEPADPDDQVASREPEQPAGAAAAETCERPTGAVRVPEWQTTSH